MRPSSCAVLCALAGSLAAGGQTAVPTSISQTRFNTGQNVAPVYEGWLKNSDGTFTFVFGYFNRNWKEGLVIPAGAENKLEPGPADRGQPTYFLPRRQSWVFRVQVPGDWGSKELVWTLTAHGRSEKAYASLTPEEEITERIIMTRGNLNPGEDDPNKPPVITIPPAPVATAGRPVSLAALVTDDGLPKPRSAPQARPGAIPTAQSNTSTAASPRGLTVTWFEYGGPAQVIFDPVGPISVSNGQALTTALFPDPGTYIVRATANDGALSTSAEIIVSVTPGSSPQVRHPRFITPGSSPQVRHPRSIEMMPASMLEHARRRNAPRRNRHYGFSPGPAYDNVYSLSLGPLVVSAQVSTVSAGR